MLHIAEPARAVCRVIKISTGSVKRNLGPGQNRDRPVRGCDDG